MEKKKICLICEKKINEKKDKYVNLRDYNKGKFESECFYHLDCWKNRFSITKEKMQQQAVEWMSNIGIVVNNLKNQMEIPQ